MANRIQDAFDDIKAQTQLIESTKQYLSEKQRNQSRLIFRRAFQRACIAVCMIFVLAAGVGGYSLYQMPVSYVSIDVNPSIELALNRFDRVVSMTAYNAEGEEILKSLSLKGKKYTDAIHIIMECKAMDAYLTDESELVFAVAAEGSREDKLKTGVERCSNHMNHKSQNISADIGIVSQAHDHGFSVGKYYTYLQLLQYDDTVTVDECRDMSISQMHGLINEHEHETDTQHSQNEGDEDLKESSMGEEKTTLHHGGHHHESEHE